MISALPSTAVRMPATVRREGGSASSSQDSRPTQIGLVVTSATLLATEVYCSDANQVAK